MSLISPLFENVDIVTDYLSKAEIFNTYFATQCTPFDESDEVTQLPLITYSSLTSIKITEEKILSIIRGLDPNKSSGWDKLYPRMITICDSCIVALFKIIFEVRYFFLINGKCQMFVHKKEFIKPEGKL